MQLSSLNANQALNRMRIERIRIDTCADDGMPAVPDTIGMHVSGLRGSLEPTMERKRQFHRKFVDYYSRSFGFARITARNLAKQLLWDRLGVLHQGVVCFFSTSGVYRNYYKRVQGHLEY